MAASFCTVFSGAAYGHGTAPASPIEQALAASAKKPPQKPAALRPELAPYLAKGKFVGQPDRSTPEKSLLTDAEELIARAPSGRALLAQAQQSGIFWSMHETPGDRIGQSYPGHARLVVDPRYGDNREPNADVLLPRQAQQLSQANTTAHDRTVAFWAATFMHETDHLLRLHATGYDYGRGTISGTAGGASYRYSFGGVDYMANARLLELMAQHTAYSWAIELANAPNGNSLPLALYASRIDAETERFLKESNAKNSLDLAGYARVFFGEQGESREWNGGGVENYGNSLITAEKDLIAARRALAQPVLPGTPATVLPAEYLGASYILRNGGSDYMRYIADDYLARLKRPLTESEQHWVAKAQGGSPSPATRPVATEPVQADAAYKLIADVTNRLYPQAGKPLINATPDDSRYANDTLKRAIGMMSEVAGNDAARAELKKQERALEQLRGKTGVDAAYGYYGVRDNLLAVFPRLGKVSPAAQRQQTPS